MKRNPESFELDQKDIETAINYWLQYNVFGEDQTTFTVTLSVKEMNAHYPEDSKQIFSALAIKDE